MMRGAAAVLLAAAGIALPRVAAADWQTSTLAGMNTHVYTPASSSPRGSGRGLLVVLHGCVQKAADLRDHGNFEHSAEDGGVVIALPDVPNGGVIAGCWDYYGANHDRTGRDDGPVLALVDALLGDDTLAVDPAQVYVAGISSGAGEAAVLGCLAPDVFAGVGIVAGPAPGTGQSDILVVSTTASQAGDVCTQLAGSHTDAFATQLAVTLAGTMDYTVAQDYAQIDAEMFAGLYGAGDTADLDFGTLPGPMATGTGTIWSDAQGPRVVMIRPDGLDHAWPSGSGQGTEVAFVSPAGPDLGAYLVAWMTANNRRVGGPSGGTSGGSSGGAAGSSDGSASGGGTTTAGGDTSGASSGQAGTTAGAGGGSSGGGCGCRSGGAGGLGWLALVIVAGRRRRIAITGPVRSGQGPGACTEGIAGPSSWA